MRMKKWVKSTIAMLALIAMLFENTYSVFAEIPDALDNAKQESVIADDSVDIAADDVLVETSPDELIGGKTSSDDLLETSSKGDEITADNDDIIEEEVDDVLIADSSINAYNDRIEVEGKKSITLYVNTDQMNSSDSFELELTGSINLDYDSALNSEMTKSKGGIYYIQGLANARFIVGAKNLSGGLKAEYKVRSDGNPQITLISQDAPKSDKKISISSDGNKIEGVGYDDFILTIDSSDIPDNTYYKLRVKTTANATCDGKTIGNGYVPSLSNSNSNIRLSNLNGKKFVLYIVGENVDTVAARYSVDSIGNGAVSASLYISKMPVVIDDDDEQEDNTVSDNKVEEAEKRVYEFEDNDVAITVTLQDAEDLPDAAELHADPINENTNPELLAEVSGRILSEATPEDYMPINFYVYDIYFTLDGEEVEPKNPVNVVINYKTKSETDYSEESVDDIKTFHFSEDANGNIKSMDEVTESVTTDSQGEVDTVTASLDSFSTVATVEYTRTRTFIGDGGAYSIGYILNNYNLFIKDTINDTNHTVGPIAAGGNSYIAWWGKQGITYPVNSYIKGKLTQGGWYESVGGGDLFLGSSNANQYRWTGNYWENNSTKEGIHGVARIYISDNYMDFNQAFNDISSEVNAFNCDVTINRNSSSSLYSIGIKSGANTLTLKSGYTYVIDSLSGIDTIDISGADVQSSVDTILKVTSSATISLFPHVSVNGNNASSAEYGKSSSIVFLLPNTTQITMRSSHAHFGHIVAPNAYVDFAGNGDYNGCVIAKSFHSAGSEGHMWPYNGKKFNGTSTGFKAVKTVDGKEPTKDQVFTFTLEKWDGSKWNVIQTVKNNGSQVAFDQITYSEKEAGTHYYRVKESGKVDGYETNNTSYIVKVVVENKVEAYAINQKKTEYTYIGDTIYSNQSVSSMTFDNITETGSIKLTKKLVTANSSSSGEFYVTLQNSKGEYYNESTASFSSQYAEIALKVGITKTISKLPYGNYSVTEVKKKALDVNGREMEVTYNVNGTSKTCTVGNSDQSACIEVDGDETVDITNRMFGQLSVTKSYIDADDKAINDGTVFYVTVSAKSTANSTKTVYYDTEGKEYSSVKVIPVAAGQTVVFAPLTAGRTYTVTETDAKGSALGTSLPYDVIGGKTSVELSETSVANLSKAVTIVNKLHKNGKINIIKKDATSGSLIDGATFYLKNDTTDALIYVTGSNGEYNYSSSEGGTFALNTKGGKLYVDGLPYGNYRLEEVVYPYGYAKNDIVMKFTVGANGTVSNSVSSSLITASMVKGSYEGTYTVNNKRIPFRLRIVKKYSPLLGGTEQPLSGVTFTLTKEGSSKTLNGVTNSEGIVEFADLDWGTYTYTETVPAGYVATESSTGTFTIDNKTSASVIDFTGTPVYALTVLNTPVSGSVKLVKTDKDTNKPMANVSFNLYNAKNNAVYAVLKNGVYTYASSTTSGATNEFKTDKNGEIKVTGLPYGSGYYFVEKTPTGYIVNNSKYNFDVLVNGKTSDVTVKNEKIRGYVELLKTDATTGDSLAGAKFALYTSAGTKIGEYTTNTSGMITASMVGALEYGSYYFKEISAPEGYSFDANKKYEFTIKENTTKAIHLEATNSRNTGKVSLVKYDSATGKTLDGAVFGLYRATDLTTPVATGTTANGGKLSFEKLQWMKYVIKEISAPEGYELNTDSFAFEISAKNLTVDLSVKYTIENDEIPGAIRLTKYDGEGKKLAGAVFELYKDGKRYPDANTTFTTDENGEIYVENLPWGTYYFVEISAPEGFVLPTGDAAKSSAVTINSKNTIAKTVNEITVQDEKIYGSLLLHKVDENGKALAGATFKLYSSDEINNKETAVKTSGKAGSYKYDLSGTVQELETDASGNLSVTGLPYGTYRIYEEKAPAGYNKDTNARKFEVKTQAQVAEYNFENTLVKANVKFIKVDDKDNVLPGASFTLFKSVNGTDVAQTTVVADKNGIVLVEGLGTGSYYFVENELEGYEQNTEKYAFTITADDNGKTITLPGVTKTIDKLAAVVNIPKKGTAKIKKVETGKTTGLSGAVFALYDAKTDKVVAGYEKLVTGADGYATAEGLVWGSYYFKEIEAPENYALDSETKYSFEINSKNVSEVVNAGTAYDDLILGGGKIIKKDSVSKEVLSGAVFALYDNGGKLVKNYERITSDENGVVTTELDLNKGTYYFVEIEAPKGYKLDSETKYYFTVDQSNMGTIVEANAKGKTDNTALNDRIPGKAQLFKYELAGSVKSGLQGAQFELYVGTKILGVFDSKKLVGTFDTNADGIISVENLEWGDYYFIETVPPTGFELNDKKVEFTISQTSLDFTGAARLELENAPSKGAIKLIKKDAKTSTVLANASFRLWQDIDGVVTQVVNKNTSNGLFVTDSKGEITVSDLSWGTYYFEEVVAPAGYGLPENTLTEKVTLDRNNVKASVSSPLVINATNDKVYGSVELLKTNDDGTIVLAGAKFELYSDASYKNKVYAVDNGNGSYTYSGSKSGAVSTFVTAANGKLTIDQIPVGTYYFKEVEAPEGYLIANENAGMFTIDERNTSDSRNSVNVKSVNVKNNRIKGYVELIKIDNKDDATKLNGVGFDLYKVNNKGTATQSIEKIGHYETVNGQIAKATVGALEYGDYYFVETETIAGYILNTQSYDFVISEQDKLITVTAENERQNGKVKLEKYNSDRSKKLNGAVFELYSTNPSGIVERIAEIFGTDYHKYGEYTTANGGIITVDNLPWGNYYFVEKQAPVGYITDTATHYNFTINADSLDVSLTGMKAAVNEEEKGAIKLIKDNGEGSLLAGAEFELYKDGVRYPNEEKTYITDENGEITVDKLPYGTYYFIEISAPEGFVLPEREAAKTASVVINETTTVSTVKYNEIKVSNEKIYGSLKLRKVDGNGDDLAGAEFYLVQVIDGSEKNVKVNGSVGVYTYDKTAGFLSTKQILETNGAILEITGLPYGTYRVYEYKAPQGYNKVDSPFEFKIDEQGKEASVNFENSLIQANVEFVKTDVNGTMLEGAVFHLYKKTSEGTMDCGTVTSDKNGKVEKKGLGAGDYFFVEDEAPEGYELNTKEYTFTIAAADNGKTVTIDNADVNNEGVAAVVNVPKKGSVKLWKVVAGTNTGLAGAEFDLYLKGTATPIKKGLVSDANGYIKVASLEWGTYYFKETKAPTGYVLDSETEYSFKIDAQNVSAEVTVDLKGNELIVENTLILGQAKLVKQNSVTNDPIEGAVFALYSADDDSVIEGYESITSDAKGIIITNKDLQAGSYYFMEVTPAVGYEINTTKYAFTITQENMDNVVSAGTNGIALNTPINGKAEILKYTIGADGESIVGLAGAEFTLYYKDSVLGISYDKEYGVYTTNADGLVSVTDLPWGEYYFKETKAPIGYKADNRKIEFTISATQLDYTGEYRLSLVNDNYLGSVKLVKYYAIDGETKGTLALAEFRFYRLEGTESVEIPNNTGDGLYVTDKNGEIVITDLPWGSYYFEEVSAPEGYALPDNKKSEVITITKDNVEESIKTPLTVSLTNDKIYGNVELLKVDDATPANRLEGAEFELYSKEGNRVYVTGAKGDYRYSETATDTVIITPADGRIVVKQLPYGEYYFVETKAPDGYLVNDEHISFKIETNQTADAEPQVTKTCINSTVRASVSFMKADTTSDVPLKGAVFTLYKVAASEDGSDLEISDVESDDNGYVTYTNLGIGKYYFVEKSTPDNAYRLLTTKYTFTVTNDDNGKTLKLDNAENNVVVNYPRYGGVKLTKYYVVNANREATLAGAVFSLYSVDEDGTDTFIKDYTTGADGTLRVSGLEWGSYYFVEKSAPNGYVFDNNKKYEFSITQENVTEVQLIEVENERLNGQVELEKLDSVDNSPLSNVVFELYKDYGTDAQALVATLTTENGKASRDGLLWGSYTLIEKTTIEGYVLNDTAYIFVIDGDNLSKSFTGVDAIKNDRIQGYVELLKKDSSTKAPMSDVQFELYKGTEAGSTYIGTYTTNAAGKVVNESGEAKIGPLDYGEYYFKEITPTGYVANVEPLSFKIEKNNQVVSFTDNKTVYNTPEDGAVILRKTDESGRVLSGAEFTLFATTPKTMGQTLSTLFNDAYEYGVYTTNENGEIRVSGLAWDTYYFVETHAPKGYEIIEPDKKYEFTINANSTKAAIEIGAIKNRQQLGTLELTKTDVETAKVLEGAEFKLYKVEENGDTDVSARYGAQAGVFKTSADGKITVNDVEWGSYYFLEIKAPVGYEAISDTNVVKSSILTVNENNADAKTNIMLPQTVTVNNQRGYGYVSLKKIFDGTQPASLEGIEFTLVNDSTDTAVGTYKTNADGVITADVIGRLVYGDYHFEEISVPVGVSYSVSNFKLAFSITQSNSLAEPLEFTFTNSEITASAKLVKVDTDSKEIIPGIKFNVYKVADDSVPVTTVTSDSQGVVMVNSLPMGDYYFLEDAESASAAGYVADTSKYMFSITSADKPVKKDNGDIEEVFVPIFKEGSTDAVTSVGNIKGNGQIQLSKLGKTQAGSQSVLDISDAEFELYKDDVLYMNSAEVAKYINGSHLVISNLPWGAYYFKEIKAPAGYALPANEAAKTNTVVIDASTVSASLTTPLVCQMSDDTIRVYISKREIAGSDELAGATLELFEANDKGEATGSPIVVWTSETVAKLIEIGADVPNGLVAGKTYIIHEAVAPLGYGIAEDIKFTVNEDGSVATSARVSGSGNGMTIVVEDAALNISISKKEMGSDKELTGATLRIKDSDDVIESWISTGKEHVIKATLEAGKSYTLEEINPPKGYYTAEPITFTVNTDGTLQITKDASASAEVSVKASALGNASTLTMYDRPIRLEISKKRLSGGSEDYVAGAELALYEQDGTDYKQIYSWVSPSTGLVLIDYGMLQVGNRYKIVETKAPAGYVKADDIYFTVKDYSEFEKTDANGMVTQTVDVFDAAVKAVFSKRSVTGDEELAGATLQVIDESGNTVVEFTSTDKETLVTSVASEAELSAEEKAAYLGYAVVYGIKLETGKSYTLHEVKAPEGYALADDVVFKVDDLGNTIPSPVVMKDKPLEVKLSKKDISTDAYLAGASLELYNEADSKVAEWISADKPVLLSIRNVGESEASNYSQVIPVLLPAGKYRLHEAAAPEGYKIAADVIIEIDGTCVKAGNGEIREETMYDYKDGTTLIKGTKEWVAPKDNEGNIATDYQYPDITIELYRDSTAQGVMDKTPYKSVVLTNGATSFAFGDLPLYRTDNGQNYKYTYKLVEVMSEAATGHYTSTELPITETEDGMTVVIEAGFKNTLSQEYTKLSGKKTFILLKDKNGNIIKDVTYEDITIYLLQNGKRVDIDGDNKDDCVVIKNGAVATNGVETFEFKNLPKYDLTTGNAYKYTVEELASSKYESKITYIGEECNIVNTPKAEPFFIKGNKNWLDPDGITRPDVTIELWRDGNPYMTTKLDSNYTFSFGPLYEYNLGWGDDEGDKKETADGHKFVYEIKESGATGYTLAIDKNGENITISNGTANVSLTNTINQEYVEISGIKYWDDKGDSSKRPAVTINLYVTDTAGRNHELYDTYIIQNTENKYEFGTAGRKQLPKYDSNGKVITYTVEEVPLKGYTSTVSGNDIINTPSKVIISKLDATNRKELPGAVLSLTKTATKEEVERWKSTNEPHYIEALEIGEKYTLTEISAPTGYSIAEPVTFTVAATGVEQKIEMLDDPILGSVVLTKLDSETRATLSGAVFNLYSSDGKIISATGSAGSYTYSESGAGTTALAVSDAGKLRVDKLPYGSYYFKEITAPAGYELSDLTVSFSIVDQESEVTVTFLNTRRTGSVLLTKANAESSLALAGAVFELYSKTPRTTGQAAASTVFSDAYYRYGTYTTDSEGRLYVDNLPWDDYYFIETQAPDGYVTNKDISGDPIVYTFTINGSTASSISINLGTITNAKGEVAGERVPEVVSGVLGVRSAPKKGVLGTRVGPATGDASAIALWLALLIACVGTIVWLLVSKKNKEQLRNGNK